VSQVTINGFEPANPPEAGNAASMWMHVYSFRSTLVRAGG
jgi:hypothetical protein